MIRALLIIVFISLLMWGCSAYYQLPPAAVEGVTKDAFYYKDLLGRGINLGDALEAPNEGDWGVVLQEEYFQLIKDAGFDSVRIPVRWSSHAEAQYPYTIDKQFFARVDWAVKQSLSRNLTTIISMHSDKAIMQNPLSHKERFLSLWSKISENYKSYPEQLYFELLGEPSGNLSDTIWNSYIREALNVIRRTNPTRMIVIGPAGWNNISHLEFLEIPQDERNIIVTFHYYEPFNFTHQGAKWIHVPAIENRIGVEWKGTYKEKSTIIRDFKKAVRWSKKQERPLHMGEFGAYNKADLSSRVRWTSFVARTAEELGIAWSYWEFGSNFGIYDRMNKRWRLPLLLSLIPSSEVHLNIQTFHME